MNKRKNDMNINMNKNNAIIAGLVVLLLLVTGILPAVIELVFGLVFGVIGLVFGLVFGALGLVLGLIGGIIGIVAGLLPIAIPVAILYFIVKGINGNNSEKPKRKREVDIDYI